MNTKAKINGEILRWAIDRSQLPMDTLAQKMSKTLEVIEEWERGDSQPTFNQAQKLADHLRIPFGYFYLPVPPIEELEIPDLRTIGDNQIQAPSPDLRDIIKQAIQKQQWYKDYLIDQGHDPLEYVGSVKITEDVESTATKIRTLIQVLPPKAGSFTEYFSTLVETIENVGVLVMRAGIVGNNTRRKLSVTEFRGFAISDGIAPVIFINSADSPSARLFTLIHELTHILIGSSGISSVSTREEKLEERFCNEVAAEFLAPKILLLKLWDQRKAVEINIADISSRLHISKIATARKALTEKLM